MIPVFDTNIIIDLSRKYPQAYKELHQYSHVLISVMTWMEVMAGVKTPQEEITTEQFLSNFEIIHIDIKLARLASTLRRKHRLKLPDAIIWATAQHRNTLLVTRNSKDFPDSMPEIRIPYHLE